MKTNVRSEVKCYELPSSTNLSTDMSNANVPILLAALPQMQVKTINSVVQTLMYLYICISCLMTEQAY